MEAPDIWRWMNGAGLIMQSHSAKCSARWLGRYAVGSNLSGC